MDKWSKITIVGSLLLVIAFTTGTMAIMAIAKPSAPDRGLAECKDGSDNDGDGYADYPSDPGCSNKNDKSELDPNVECDDGADNDGDNAIDYMDGGCSGPSDNDETNCGDGACEGGETSGTCPADCGYPDSCSDTDGGNVITVLGTTSGYLNGNPYNHSDYCVDSGTVMEYYCSGNYEQSQQQSCGTDYYSANYCMNSSVYRDFTDYYCNSGLCGNSVTPEFVENCEYGCTDGECNGIPDSCSDTDGFNTLVQGTVSGYLSEQPYSYTDSCATNSSVIEWYCSGVYAYNVTLNCMNATTTCLNGACI